MAADALAAGSVFTEKWLVNIGLIGEVHMSIKKIAEKAGVSISTVSRILNRPDYKGKSDKHKCDNQSGFRISHLNSNTG